MDSQRRVGTGPADKGAASALAGTDPESALAAMPRRATVSSSGRREPASANRHPRRGRAGRLLSARIRRAAGVAVLAAAVLLAAPQAVHAAVPTDVTRIALQTYATTTPGSIEFLNHDGGIGATNFEFRTSTDSGVNWSHAVTDDWPDTTRDSKNNNLLGGLVPGTAYTFELRGRNADGYSAAAQATATTAGAVSITGVALTSSPASGTTYDTGEDIVATLTFSRPVTFAEVGGNLPRLELNFGGTAKPAICAAANQKTAVTCTYTVVMGDTASGGVAIAANKLTLNGGTIRLGSGSNANLDYTVPLAHTALAADTDHKVGDSGTSTNAAPVFSPTTATRSVPENTTTVTNVGAAIHAATDTDPGDSLTYSMEGTDAASFTFDAATRQIKTKTGVTYDHEAKDSYSVTIKVSDGTATATVAVTIGIADVDEPPAAPDAPTVTATSGTSTSVDVAWSAPTNTGKPAIEHYDLQYRVGSTGSFTADPADGRDDLLDDRGADGRHLLRRAGARPQRRGRRRLVRLGHRQNRRRRGDDLDLGRGRYGVRGR